jgi:hypothetical protein
VTLAVFGGMLGIAAGIGASALISHFAGWTTHTGVNAIVIAFCFSGLVGIFFRVLSRPQGRTAESNRSPALRMIDTRIPVRSSDENQIQHRTFDDLTFVSLARFHWPKNSFVFAGVSATVSRGIQTATCSREG